MDKSVPCYCGNLPDYAHCCEPLHRGEPAASAEALMRSRYSAYVLKLEVYLLATWHATTRPASLDLANQQPAPTWLGLSVKRHETQNADRAIVEFIARVRYGGGSAQRLHEVSRFIREDGHWFYVDGVILQG